ncbi:hypothetical protein WJX72_002097 [[Myrmecia] bisecta]|uniref:Uncharacterized protein n=1 Tax=[Myrmecia] bisecta TaxID=41462 RepID=A0AAW1QPJ4_9CHLO
MQALDDKAGGDPSNVKPQKAPKCRRHLCAPEAESSECDLEDLARALGRSECERKRSCPSCSNFLTKDHIFPNFLLNKVISKAAAAKCTAPQSTAVEQVQQLLSSDTQTLKLNELNSLLQVLWERKQQLEQQEAEANLELLLHFLHHSREEKPLSGMPGPPGPLEAGGQADAPFQPQQHQQWQELRSHEEAESQWQPAAQPLAGMHWQQQAEQAQHTREQGERAGPAAEPFFHAPVGSSRPGVAGGYNIIQHQHTHLPQILGTGAVARASGDGLNSFQNAPPGLNSQQQSGTFHAASWPAGNGSSNAASYGGLHTQGLEATQNPTGATGQPVGHSNATDSGTRTGTGTVCEDGMDTSHHERSDSIPNEQLGDMIRAKKRRLASQFDDLQQCYLRLRKSDASAADTGNASAPAALAAATAANGGSAAAKGTADGTAAAAGLAEFSRMLSVFTHCGKLKVIAQLPRASTRQSSSILSSIEFDRDSQVFATAGVSKRISIFEYAAVMNNPHADVHCPAMELVTRSKLSCLAWNKYIKSHLISSDYEGVVTLWDVNSSQMVMEYEAHEKRIWSVDFCHADPMLLVSGSDDGWVKVWSTKQANSVCEIDMKANVCCVKYNPGSMYEVAIGSADHNVHLYDLRKTHEAVYVFSGHRKAVSYVRYLNSSEVVSASTDSTLRLWNTQGYTAARTYSGHVNEKNFVGLSADSEFVACGSESNEVFVYYKAMSKPIARRLFSSPATPPAGAAPPVNQDTSQFISAVCWKPYSQVLLAANSQGTIKVMQLTS